MKVVIPSLILFAVLISSGPITAQECLTQGQSAAVVPGQPDCCEGLVYIGCDAPNEAGECPQGACVGAAICAACPNGVCEAGENICNCPDDCQETAAPESACLTQGQSAAVVPGQPDCCEGLVYIGCDVPNEAGECPEDECAGAAICAACPNGVCEAGENVCNCPDDCQETSLQDIGGGDMGASGGGGPSGMGSSDVIGENGSRVEPTEAE